MTDPPPFEPDPGLTRGGSVMIWRWAPFGIPILVISPCKIAVLGVQNRKIFAPAARFPLVKSLF